MKYMLFLTALIFLGCTSQNKNAGAISTPATVPAAASASVPVPMVQNPPPASDLHKWFCVKGQDKRELEVVKKDDGCILDRTEEGKMAEETNGTHGVKQCKIAEKKILAKLKKEGFRCS